MIETIFAFFALSWVPWGLSAVLVVGALLIWLDFRRRLRPVLAGLDEALAIVEEAATPAAFRDRFPSINEALARQRDHRRGVAELCPDLGSGAGSGQGPRRHPAARR